jgi:hypothetical protein
VPTTPALEKQKECVRKSIGPNDSPSAFKGSDKPGKSSKRLRATSQREEYHPVDSVTPTPTPTPTWTKQILPEGSYTHQEYSPELLTRVVELFNPGKGVPFTLSSIKDPTKANAGILRGVEYHPTLGILGHFELTDEAAATCPEVPTIRRNCHRLSGRTNHKRARHEHPTDPRYGRLGEGQRPPAG